jgi:small-conductance mechanosensitive channel
MDTPGLRMNPNAVQFLVPGRRPFASVFRQALGGHTVTFALAALITVPIGRHAEGQELPGIPPAATQEPEPTVEPTSPEQIASRRTSVDAELRALDATLEDADPANVEHLRAVGDRLQEIIGLLEKQAALVSRAASVEEMPPLPSVEAPSVFALNELYEAQFLRGEADRTHKDLLAASREALAAAKETLAAADRERRRARAELENAAASEKASAKNTLELRELESRIAQEEVYLRRAEMLASRGDGEEPEVAELEQRIDEMRAALARGEGSSASGFVALTKRAEELRRGREATERSLATAELNLKAAQSRYVQQVEPSAELLAQVESLIASCDAMRQEIALVDAQLERLDSQRAIWSYWEALLRGEGSADDLQAWETSVRERVAALKQAEPQRAERASGLRLRIDKIEDQRSDLPAGSALHAVLGAELETLSLLHQKQRDEAAALAADRRMSERVLGDIYERTGRVDPLEYAARSVEAARSFWSYEITTVDDASITVGSLVLALLLLFIGLWAARRGSRFVARASKARFNLDTGAAHALQTLSFYVFLVTFTLLALRAVHFPLTAFTVLGGALAIGVGFGSQNVMNNFISGLILMLDRPVRAHDVVEVDGNLGTVEKIGARSTQIRSTDGRHIIVPNSFFLQSNVVNWTLSDDLIRAKVSVGVIYGSPTRLVEQLIRQVMDEDAQILKVPEPIVVFEEFGDNSLNFDVYFWVRARSPMEMRTVQSRVRFRIDDLFRENKLVIAFPQRDVHIDSAAPVEVRILTDDGRTTSQSKREAT